MEAQATPRSLKSKHNKRIRSEVPWEELEVGVRGLLSLGYEQEKIKEEKEKQELYGRHSY
jgi:hypothetical protein